MKKYVYQWNQDTVFLLHVQFNNHQKKEYNVVLSREYEGGKTRQEVIPINADQSHRIIVSRTHPKERSFSIEYPQENTIEVFKVDDRAYYPTESFYVG